MNNDSHLPPSPPPVSRDNTGNALEIRSNSENGLAHTSAGHGYPNQPYGSRDESEGFDLQRLIAIVLRRWPVMISIFLLATVLGIFTIVRSQPVYQAVATLEMSPPQQNNPSFDIPGMQNFATYSGSDMLETQLENLRGSEIQNLALSKLKPEQRQVLSKLSTLNVAQMGATRLVTVSVQSYDPVAAAALANSVCEQYIAVSLATNKANSRGAVDYVEGQLGSVRNRLFQAQSALKVFKLKTGVFNISEVATALASKSATLQSDLEAATAERASSQARLQGLQGLLSRLPANKVVPQGIQRNPAVTDLQTQLTKLELERTDAIRVGDYTPTSRKVRALDGQIATLKAQLQREAKTIVNAWTTDPSRAPVATDAASAQAQLWSLDARIAALKTQSAQAKKNLSALPEQEFRYSQLATDTQVLQQTYQLLNERLQALKISENAHVADARLASKAQPVKEPVAPNKTRILIYTMSVGLLAALGIGLLLDLMDNHIYSEDDVHRVTGLPVLVQIPMFRDEQQFNLLKEARTQMGKSSPLLETFRMLRTNIRLSVIDKPVRSVVITSSMPSEGKSHTALNLAVAAASSGDRVILVDLDLRRPSAHRICDLPNTLGFTSVVSNQCSLQDALQDTSVGGLRVLTSGPLPPNPFRLLNSQAARTLIESLSQEADLVVIDTPPMLTMADALLISSWVDGTLMVISSSDMKKRDVGRTADMLFQNNNEVLGTILTKVTSTADGYYHYYGYKNYNHYFDDDGDMSSREQALTASKEQDKV